MKKIFVIVFLMPLTFLTACTSQEATPNQTIDSPKSLTGVTETSSTTKVIEVTPESNSGSTIIEQKTQTPEIAINTNRPITIYSPVHTLTWTTLSDTTKVEVVFSWTTKTDKYILTKFKAWDSEFVANLRLDYGNIEKWRNFYEVISYQGEEAVASDKYEVNVDYEEIKVGWGVFYLWDRKSIPLRCSNEIEPILIQEKWKFRIIQNDCFTYSKENDYYLEMRNIKTDIEWTEKWDLYINWKMLDKNITFHTSTALSPLRYDKLKNIFFQEVWPYPWDCGTGYYKTIYDINNQTYAWFSVELNICRHILTQIFPWLVGGVWYDGLEKTENSIAFYTTTFERLSHLPTSSVFSIRNWDYSKNYIYDSRLNFTWAIKQEENDSFLYKRDNYALNLWNKKYEIDFQKLKQEKQKMNDLLYRMDHLFKKEDPNFTINMKKNNDANSFTLFFDIDKTDDNTEKNSKTSIKTIWITSCKPNNSPEYDQEYILKTQTDEWNFSYNISEELGNKCDIPYKIQVTYEDGTKELWEYYILFDY